MNDAARQDAPLISVVIVNYKVPLLLRECLRSLSASRVKERVEIIVVDNNSADSSHAMVSSEFPGVSWVGLKSNIGFGKASNVGARMATGEYLLLLNPDTTVHEETLAACVAFMRKHPEAGMLGPKILNSDGTLQISCRRSFPTPLVAFYRFTGLSALFPKSKRFGRYNLTFLDPDQPARVDAISGSFMFLPRSVFERVGGFDERFFMYGEDLDLCQRVHELGCEVWYCPDTQIVHFKGRSSAKRSLRSRANFYEAMILFSRKYRHLKESFFPSWLVYIGIFAQAAVNIGVSLMRSLTACFIDLLTINVCLLLAITVRFYVAHKVSPYGSEAAWGLWITGLLHLFLSGVFVLTYWYRGVYSRTRYSVRNALASGLFATMLFMACVYFVPQLAFSRIAFAGACVAITFLVPLWRELLPKAVGHIRHMMYATGTVIILGSGDVARQLVLNIEKDRSARIAGVVWPEDTGMPVELLGYPVLGSIISTRRILESQGADMLLIATDVPWYSHIIETLASHKVRNLSIRWVPRELLQRSVAELPERIPLHDFNV